MTCRSTGVFAQILLVCAAIEGGCERRTSQAPQAPAPSRASSEADAAPAIEPSVLIALPVAAYHASITADGDVAYLLTEDAAYRLAPGRAPERLPIDLGEGATTTRSSFIYWSRGGVRAAPKAGGAARRLAALPERPQKFVASDTATAWVQRTDGRFSLGALRGNKPANLYTSPGSIDAVAIAGDAIFFVERPAAAGWRIGRVAAAGGAPAFMPPRDGRPPAMLAAGRDLAFYTGAGYEVHRLSLDFAHERTIASGFVCSPLAVAEHVYCAQVEGIFELRTGERPRRLVPGSAQRLVTDIAVGATHLTWIVDAGPDKLEVRALPLPR